MSEAQQIQNDDSSTETRQRRLMSLCISRGSRRGMGPRAVAAVMNHAYDDEENAVIEICDVGTPAWEDATAGGDQKMRDAAAKLNYIIERHNDTHGTLTIEETNAIKEEIKAHDAFHIAHPVTAREAAEYWQPQVEIRNQQR